MELKIDTRELLRWARLVDEVPDETKRSIANALNQFGNSIARQMAVGIAQETGLPIHQVSALFDISPASARNLYWELDTSRVAGVDTALKRRMPSRPWEKGEEGAFLQALVKVITAEDEMVCEKCQEIADNGPYTLEVARAMIPAHPNCRCLVQSFTPSRRAPVTFANRFGAAPRAHTQLLSIEQLASKIRAVAEQATRLLVRTI